MNEIQFINEKDCLVIKMPKDLLAHIFNNNPDNEGQYKVKDVELFCTGLLNTLENEAWDSNPTELGLTNFQYFIDEAMQQVCENASDGIEEIENY